MFLQVSLENSYTENFTISGIISKAGTYGCMARATVKVFSMFPMFGYPLLLKVLTESDVSDDIVDAAWANTLGVHALIWVRHAF